MGCRYWNSECRCAEQKQRSAGLRAKALVGREPGDLFDPMVRTIRHPPISVPSPIAALRREDDPQRHVEFTMQMAGAEQEDSDDPHRLLRVVGAMADRRQAAGGQ